MKSKRVIGFEEYRERIKRICAARPSHYALMNLMDSGEVLKLRYSAMYRYVQDFAKVKQQYGLKDGDRVLLLEPIIADAVLSFVILSCCHLTVVFADAGLPKEELDQLIDETQVCAIFTDKKRFDLVKNRTNVPIFHTYCMDHKLTLLQDTAAPHQDYPLTPDSVAIIFSSGTTSKMKPIEISYSSLCLAADNLFIRIHLTRKELKGNMLMVYPMSHVSGLSCASALILTGITMSSVESVNSASLVKGLKTFRPVLFGMVAKVLAIFINKLNEGLEKKHLYGVYNKLRKISAFFRINFGIYGVGRFLMAPFREKLFCKELRCIPSGGTQGIPEVISEIFDLGIAFCNSYGSTECGNPIFTTDYRDTNNFDTVGTPKYNPDAHIVIHNPDKDGVGEIYVKTKYIMNGYYGDPVRTKEAFDHGFFKTGDLGYFDKDNYLHISGRIKDCIVLPSGKKVAPDDLEGLLLPIVGVETSYAVVGVPIGNTGADSIHIYIADDKLDESGKKELDKKIRHWQKTEAPMYPIDSIHFVNELPKTSVGKIKRNVLRVMALSERKLSLKKSSEQKIIHVDEKKYDKKELVTALNEMIMRSIKTVSPLTGHEDLTNDLGIDSLTMMEICTEIEERYGVFVGGLLKRLTTVSEIADYIIDPSILSDDTPAGICKRDDFNAFDYPLKRNNKDRMLFKTAVKWSEKRINFKVEGLENVKKNKQYIFCPNHQTHFDGLWTWAALGDKCPDLDQIGCMSKREHLDSRITKTLMKMLGGIPVDRAGNTMASFKRSIDFIREGNSFLIHPEGTRTRDGKLGPFKDGAALMSVETGVDIVPVAIEGGFEVWPYYEKLPLKIDPETGKKHTVTITFCKPVSPEGKTTEEIMHLVRQEIESVLTHFKKST